jgi:hypothetical protein
VGVHIALCVTRERAVDLVEATLVDRVRAGPSP